MTFSIYYYNFFYKVRFFGNILSGDMEKNVKSNAVNALNKLTLDILSCL